MSDIIEISSSPESSSSRPLRRKRMPLFLPEREEQEIIEITDSDSSTPRKRRKLEHGNEQPQAGPSNAINPQAATPAPRRGSTRRGSTRPKTPSTSKQPAVGRADEQITAASQVQLPERLTPPDLPPPREPSLQSIVLDEEPPPSPEPEDPFQLCLAQVHEIVPDVLPEYVLQLIQTFQEKGDLVGEVLHALFEDPTYPRINSKGKAKAVLPERKAPSAQATTGEIDFSRVDRDRNGGPVYVELAREQLYVDFPDIPQVHVNAMLAVHLNLYAPAYLYLQKERRGAKLPYVPELPKNRKRRVSAKKKGKRKAALHDAEFLRERTWLLAKLAQDAANIGKEPAVGETSAQEIVEEVDGIECGCCFTEYPFDQMIQCEDAHLFCNECVISYASTKLGEHNPDMCCMDQSGCKLPFPDSELRRILPEKLHSLYERVRQQREVEAACLEGLEECPFCEFKAVLEVDVESDKLFRCQNEECGRASCRKCKKEDHTPKSCQEMEEDKKLDGKHAIEEAMSRALMRNCPSCKKGFIKESGCNKMTCPNCRTLSCYVCREVVSGYDHFQQTNTNGQPLAGASTSTKCPLWDPVEKRHADEVAAAAKKALDDYKRDHPDIEEDEIKVDLPPPPAGAAGLLFGAVGVQNHAHAPPYQHLMQAAAPGIARMPAPPPQPRAPPVGPQHFWHIFPANPDIQVLQRPLQEGQQADVLIQQQQLEPAHLRQLEQHREVVRQRLQAQVQAQAQRQALHRERQEALAQRQQQAPAEQQARQAQQQIQLQMQQLLMERGQAAMRQAPAPIAVAPKAVRRKQQ
ncbi:hypothetical protein HETIRDRAFT_476396 [Heterobasidion irregulare TC 32-1]|uniref:RING-type domain-containing protein n=1 Tax=Heterobasidion irregulare (strain TC 32-1) TaxID=747525 RepID=W4K4D5_HETIT|nr:uncharacterized protein HETIRDRAFT_476396 [Heterobasidion irregulare TC 32-1]ETW80698.1 hypothetical protein HETIRDRAFT_476396 [Heterobasidion irregulare TC 32-1]